MLFKSVVLATLAVASYASTFNFVRDEAGYAILPPTEVVLSHLSSQTPEEDPSEYHVIKTVAENGEVIRVNLHTHQQASTGIYKRDYDNSVYYDQSKLAARTIFNNDGTCFNKDEDFETGACDFDFVGYDNPDNCSGAGGSKYSCVVDIEHLQDATVKAKDLDPVAALVRCYKDLDSAKKANATGGACGK
ncbi:uncharacterized protein CANTADRAFT_7988 [Suhomyces tanzawaensis NRRL Y-17324]|uniref:Uncharacterized protein n=1 Tax=Suhomyces tanzawaensis NRRL Y-17324 TaxID=984487 RepID=A0A1E4SDD5_9ASCO|nr:uncharacterized protein CANTADRAFT_7988 [Suhomyces tanzawaensis NRRL Y-17324]ODV77531.1 hypothetical protein CANTADRAFT_7988 [Suhomyces tanzawaensis NRRL Y-17324]